MFHRAHTDTRTHKTYTDWEKIDCVTVPMNIHEKLNWEEWEEKKTNHQIEWKPVAITNFSICYRIYTQCECIIDESRSLGYVGRYKICERIAIKCIFALRATFRALCSFVIWRMNAMSLCIYARARVHHKRQFNRSRIQNASATIWGDHAVLHSPYAMCIL